MSPPCRPRHTRQNTTRIYDAAGIFLAVACRECKDAVMAKHPPEVLGISGNYTDVVQERIEPGDP